QEIGKKGVKAAFKEILLFPVPGQQGTQHRAQTLKSPLPVRCQYQGNAVVIPDGQAEAVAFKGAEKGGKGEHGEVG
ncbi:MAG: hypothetical protein D3910_29150, partial [Candidatus Electrothrix sp. ATG2]|nr:hypothetical protein [Candidatus Electrothrix sp. ATG2]